MRLLVAIENQRFKDGRMLAPGSIYMPEDKSGVPVTYGGGLSEVVGIAGDIQREGDIVTMDVVFNNSSNGQWLDKQSVDTLMANVNLAPVVEDEKVILTGGLRAVSIAKNPAHARNYFA